ncbi:hypothetical protein ABEX69_16800 [Bacillus safensis]|uniref:hypothetical protein n=1 Tax=Bacillus safensis TaxID=561879 RepID=UPI00227E5CBA|nr:hypothetical protein [Bacillus safensis]MCY7565900.1 hypothetical protein [Bacillus safensis]MCY7625999.1 hypothetical protein [Bacillus safensis]MCY7634228.1 hypothetical protein [Bacillus safensis]MCY7647008.1 hypothetical protein [Bacillus safensis]MCY7650800.1 hypothetical protein [Bacillus safensis]
MIKHAKKLKTFLDLMVNPGKETENAIQDFHTSGGKIIFQVNYKNVDIALKIAGLLGENTSNYSIQLFYFPDTDDIDFIQFAIAEIHDRKLLNFLEEMPEKWS